MAAPLDCPPLPSWQSLFEDVLAPEQRADYEQHLETCQACQERLRWAERESDPLLSMMRQVGDPTIAPADPTLGYFLSRLHELGQTDRVLAAEPPDLFFLQPTSRPDVLGTLGRYEVEEVIGQGGMGIVLKAFDPALHRPVAIKVMAPALAGSATARRRFTREARAVAAVRHDHVVTVHGVHEAQGLPYLVMQYVAGESLQARLDRCGPLDAREVGRIGKEAALGLAAAHARGLIHRDIKPANLLLESGSDRVKITDFGLARAADDLDLTQAGVVAGTPEYMAPEQARGETVDHRADLFSLGCVLYAMCTGEPPVGGVSAEAALRRVGDRSPPPFASLRPDLPLWLQAFIMRMLELDPAARFQSAAEVADLLGAYLNHLGEPDRVPAPILPPPADEAPSSAAVPAARRWLPALFAALAILGLGGALWLAGGPPEPGPVAKYKDEYAISFKGEPANSDTFEYYGPDAERCVRYEPAGVRLALPAGYPGQRPGTGVTIPLHARGDFEVTVSFEMLQEPAPPPAADKRSRFTLDAVTDGPARAVGTLSRNVGSQLGTQFFAWMRITDEATQKEKQRHQWFIARTKSGRLRMTRVGSELSYQVADGPEAEFVLIATFAFVADDLKAVRLVGATGDPAVSLEVRAWDLRIRAESLPDRPEATPDGSPPARPKALTKTWLTTGVIGLTLAAAGLAAAWLVLSRRRAAASPSVVFPCSGCGKRLRAAVELSGRKVKCPRCGETSLVPPSRPASAPPATVSRRTLLILGVSICGITAVLAGLLWLWLRPPDRSEQHQASWLNLTVGSEYMPELNESGFYLQEYDRGQLFRWTNGNARLVIPIERSKPPQSMYVRLLIQRQPRVPQAQVEIAVNGRALFRDHVPVGRWEQSFDLGGMDLGEELVLQLDSDTFVPVAGDPRSLGVQVRGIKLVRDEEAREAAPRLIDQPAARWPGHSQGAAFGAITPDGQGLVSGSWDGTVALWDVPSARERSRITGLGPYVRAVGVSPDCETIAAAPDTGMVHVRHLRTGRRQSFRGHEGRILALAFSPDATTLASAGDDSQSGGHLNFWDPATGKGRVRVETFPFRLWGLAYAPDGQSVAVVGAERSVQVVATETGRVMRTVPLPHDGRCVAFSPDGTLLAVAYGNEGDVRVYELASGTARAEFRASGGDPGLSLHFSRDGRRLLTPCGDGTARVWDIGQSPARAVATLKGHEGQVWFAAFSPDGRIVATGAEDGTLGLWAIE
jgi:WD40 repeat protein